MTTQPHDHAAADSTAHSVADARETQRKAMVLKIHAPIKRYKTEGKIAEARGANRAMLLIRRRD